MHILPTYVPFHTQTRHCTGGGGGGDSGGGRSKEEEGLPD